MASVMRFDQWQDSNGVPVATGAGGKFSAPGNVLQVVQTVKTDTFSATSTAEITGLNVSITPSAASNKILVTAFVQLSNSSATGFSRVRLRRGTTDIFLGTSGTSVNETVEHIGATNQINGYTITFLDSPNTTSSVNYNLTLSGVDGTAYLNRRGTTDGMGVPSSIIVMEVAG
jgi:hypothetical protein